MRTIKKVWIVAFALSFWLFFTPCVQAISVHVSNAQVIHHLPPDDIPPKALFYSLPETKISQLKLAFFDNLKSHCLESSYLTEIEASYCAVIKNSFDFVAWNNLGYKLFTLGHNKAALAAYDHSLLINPQYSLALANRCGVLSRLKEYEQALNSCKLALRGDGHWGRQGAALAWNNQGDVLFNLKRYQESLKSFEQAIAINHNCASAQRNRAVVLRQLHKMMQG